MKADICYPSDSVKTCFGTSFFYYTLLINTILKNIQLMSFVFVC